MKERIQQIGIIVSVLNLLAVTLFVITKTDDSLTFWEWVTIIGAIVFLFVLLDIAEYMELPTFEKDSMLVFMSGTCILTGVAHIVNMIVTRQLIADGVAVPDCLKIGLWPSVEMVVDYLAWGFFMGLAFLAVGFGIHKQKEGSLFLKRLLILCGVLCWIGFFAALYINENLWYIATVGYAVGPIVISTQVIRMRKRLG